MVHDLQACCFNVCVYSCSKKVEEFEKSGLDNLPLEPCNGYLRLLIYKSVKSRWVLKDVSKIDNVPFIAYDCRVCAES